VTKQKSLFQHEIHTTTEKPIHSRIFRRSATSKLLIDQEVEKMLNAKIIRNSFSPWSSQPCMVKKKDGSLRFTVDYRSLNKITIPDPYPIPRIDDIHDTLSNSKWYSTLDMKAGYWQIEMHPDSIAKTAFSTNNGHYEFMRMPFGIKNGPADFNRAVLGNFHDMRSEVEVYFDDIIPHSKDDTHHLEALEKVFKRIRNLHMKLSLSKCKFFNLKVKCLGVHYQS
jgi:putative transposase